VFFVMDAGPGFGVVLSWSRTTQLAHEIKARRHGRIGVFPKAMTNANDAKCSKQLTTRMIE
jgi:hypothetical protein